MSASAETGAMLGEGEPFLAVSGLSKNYGGLRALNNVSLSVDRGEVVALVGDNGAGKSTLIKAISGALRPDGGEIRLDGTAVSFKTPREAADAGIETVHQNLGLVDALDVPQNVFLGREMMHKLFGLVPQLDAAAMRRETVALLNRFSINIPTLNEPVSQLSGGQRQTIAISRLLLVEPQLLIMDEPMAALGVDEGRKVLDLVVTLKKSGLAILLISHNLEHVLAIADRIVVLKNGELVGAVRTAETTRDAVVSMITFGRS